MDIILAAILFISVCIIILYYYIDVLCSLLRVIYESLICGHKLNKTNFKSIHNSLSSYSIMSSHPTSLLADIIIFPCGNLFFPTFFLRVLFYFPVRKQFFCFQSHSQFPFPLTSCIILQLNLQPSFLKLVFLAQG